MDAALDKIMEARKYDGVAANAPKASREAAREASEEHEKARAGLFPALVGK